MLLFAAAALPALLGGQPAPPGCVDVPAPKVNYRANVARATSSPWVDNNAWRFVRHPDAMYCIDAPGRQSALAAAEAFAFGVTAFIKGVADAAVFDRMIQFLRALPAFDAPALVNAGIVDDGSDRAGELMNLMMRRNLLFRAETKADPRLSVNIAKMDDPDPSKEAYRVRQQIGDDRRLVRVYGTEVVIARLTGDAARTRVHLLNYSGRPVNGVRVRVLGNYATAEPHIFGVPDAKLLDYVNGSGFAEFTVAALNEYAVIDLLR